MGGYRSFIIPVMVGHKPLESVYMYIHFVFIILIIFAIYLVYGAFFKDFGLKFLNGIERMPTFYSWFWPKSVKGSIIAFKIFALSLLIECCVLELLLIIGI
jgi:hypothetical protein